MKTLEHIEARLSELEAQLKPLLKEKTELEAEQRDAQSLAFIKANGITLADIQSSKGDGVPYFGVVWAFGQWLKDHSSRPWAEWTGRLYRSSDLILGRMPESIALAEHVKI
jgi:hypothetical protein